MKQKTNLLIIAMLGVLIFTLTSVDSFAQNQRKNFVADTGVINLGQNQKLRATVTPADDNKTIPVRFRRCLYSEQNGIFMVNSTQISPFMLISSNEARFFDVFAAGAAAVRLRVGSTTPEIVVTFQLIDTSTGEIVWADEAVVTEQDIWATAG